MVVNEEATQSEIRKQNAENFNVIVNGRTFREPRRTIYIHSVAKRDFGPISRPLFTKITLRGCTKGERVVLSAKIPDPVLLSSPDQERGGTRVDEHDGWRAAIDLLNPANLTTDPYGSSTYASGAPLASDFRGCNLVGQGLFPSFNEVPTEAEIARAEKARDDRFRSLVQRAQQLEATSPKQLQELLMEQPDVHTAMDALGLESSWHRRQETKAHCPNCGDSIRPGVAFHRSTVTEEICIIDKLRAAEAGVFKRGPAPKPAAE